MLGYAVSPYVIDAADHGVPQHRKRLFLLCTKSVAPIVVDLPKRDHRPIRDVIEWDAPGWSPIATPKRSARTLARIGAGRRVFGERFVAPYYGNGSGLTGRSVDRPIGTITTVDRWAIVDGDCMRMLHPREAKQACGFRSTFVLPANRRNAMHLLGNAVMPPVAADLLIALQRAA